LRYSATIDKTLFFVIAQILSMTPDGIARKFDLIDRYFVQIGHYFGHTGLYFGQFDVRSQT